MNKGDGTVSPVCVHAVVSEGSYFGAPGVLKLGTGAPMSKVDKRNMAGQHVGDYMIGFTGGRQGRRLSTG